MTLDDIQRTSACSDADDFQLSAFEKALVTTYTRLEITGKKGKHVPIILSPLMKEALDTIVSLRSKITPSKANKYVFALLNGRFFIRASDVLRRFSEECGAEHPERLRSTRLRKQIATQLQVMNLQENEMDIIASFLGHDLNTHRKHYRIPNDLLQVTKVTKILLAMEKGIFKSLAGRNLDDIDEEELEGKACLLTLA